MCVLVYKPDIMFSVSSFSSRLINSGSIFHCSQVSRLQLQRIVLDWMCMWRRVCVRGSVQYLVEIVYMSFEYKAIISLVCTLFCLI